MAALIGQDDIDELITHLHDGWLQQFAETI
jgi:hypothetical protein